MTSTRRPSKRTRPRSRPQGYPADQDPLSQSHVKETNILFPYSQVFLDFLLAGGIPACSDADLAADTCSPATEIGDLSATVPVVDPPDFTGKLYRTNHPEIGFFTVAAVLNGPRGIRAVVRGQSAFVPTGTAFIFPSQPQVPLTALEVELTKKINLNLSTCGTKTIHRPVRRTQRRDSRCQRHLQDDRVQLRVRPPEGGNAHSRASRAGLQGVHVVELDPRRCRCRLRPAAHRFRPRTT